MKRLLTLLALKVLIITAFAQTPEKMSYQAVIRDASNNLIINQSIGMQVSILQGSITGPSVYTETQIQNSNMNGLVSLEIGTGTVILGTFSNIDWSNGPYFIKTETDPTGGVNYTITGSTQLMSVPYALHSKTADSLLFDRTFLYLRKKATSQNIPNNTNTTINNYDNISSNDITINNSSGIITFNKSGVYIITGHLSIAASNPGRKLIWFDCVSNRHPQRIGSIEISSVGNRISTSVVGEFDSGDQISFSLFQGTGVSVSSPNTTQPYDETQVNIERIH
jgi:hypothetical protein